MRTELFSKHRPIFFTLFTLPLIAMSTGCGLDTFIIKEEAKTTIPAGTLVETLLPSLGFDAFTDFDITDNQELANQGVTRNQIDSVTLTELILEVPEESAGQDFDFLSAIAFYAEADGLDRIKLAELESIPDDVTRLELEVTLEEMADHVSADSMSIVTEASGRRPEDATIIKAFLEMRVDVDVGGALGG